MSRIQDRSFDMHGDVEDRMELSLFSDSTQHPWRNYSNLGLLHRQMGQLDLAVFWLEKALELEPNSQVVRAALSQTFESMGRMTDALYHLKHIAAAQGRDVQRWVVNELHRLSAPDAEEEEEVEETQTRSQPRSATSQSVQSASLASPPPVSPDKKKTQRRMTMVDKLAAGEHRACCSRAQALTPTQMTKSA